MKQWIRNGRYLVENCNTKYLELYQDVVTELEDENWTVWSDTFKAAWSRVFRGKDGIEELSHRTEKKNKQDKTRKDDKSLKGKAAAYDPRTIKKTNGL